MNQLTPAREISDKDLTANRQAFARCLSEVSGPILNVLDVRYGLGGWAREVRSRYPGAKVLGFERDRATADSAWTDPWVTLINEEWTPAETEESGFGLVCADFNVTTAKNRTLLDELVGSVEARNLIFTDVACGKLHLNFRHYGLKRPSLGDYWKAFRIEDYELVTWERVHHAASTALFQRKSPGG